MKKIINPFAKTKNFNCFGCSPKNEIGLKLEFFLENDCLLSFWEPDRAYEGYNSILHGGIQATIMDETAAWAVNVLLGTGGVTSNINIKYLKPVFLKKGKIKTKALLNNHKKRQAIFEVELFDGEKQLCAKGLVEYFVYPEKIAMKKLGFPGKAAFVK